MSGPDPEIPDAPDPSTRGELDPHATTGPTVDWKHPSESDKTVLPDDETVEGSGPLRLGNLSGDDETIDSPVAITTNPPSASTRASFAATDPEPAHRATLGLTNEHNGRYRPLDTLGQGGIGVVLRAFDGHIGREVAIKELKTGKKVIKPSTRRRFIDEARITAQLEHPGIVPVYELGKRADGTVYYAMRCLRGGTLAEAMKGKELDDRLRLIPRLIDVCQAMAYAHSHGVVHRDLKPANVMLGEFGETLVLDWGLAKLQADSPTTLQGAAPVTEMEDVGAMQTMQGQVLGTPAYMPPEQARGDIGSIGATADVYALGAILYELLTGRPPYVGKNAWDVVRKVRERDIKPPSKREPGTPPELEAIAMRALHRDPDRRYPDARAMVADLDAALVHASPADRIEFGIYRHVIALKIAPRRADLSGLDPNGEMPWADRMLRLARGALEPDDVLPTIRTPEQRCLFELAIGLWEKTTGNKWKQTPVPHAYARRTTHVHILSCAMVRGLAGKTWKLTPASAVGVPGAVTTTNAAP